MFIKSRRRAREIALRILYELEIGKMGPAKVLQTNLDEANLTPDLAAFAKQIVTGIWDHDDEIKGKISENLTDWEYDRLAVIDRHVLRIATYELMFLPQVPPAVSINEAIEIAKKYSTVESGRFVNGVLANVLKATDKVDWTPPESAEEEEPASNELEEEEIPAVEEEEITEEDAAKLARVGGWKLRSTEEISE